MASILEKNGGWPMAKSTADWKEDGQSWQEVDEKFTRVTGDYTFFDIRPYESLTSDSEDQFMLVSFMQCSMIH